MTDRLYLVFEIIAVLLCLHGLYGEKFKWNIYTILLIGIEFVVYQMEIFFDANAFLKVFLYTLIYIYSVLQFRKSWKLGLLNYSLCMIISSIMQLLCYFPVMIWYGVLADKINFVVNIIVLCVMFVLYRTGILHKISVYMQQKGKIVAAFLILAVGFIFFTMYKFGVYNKLGLADYIILILSVILLFVLLLLLQRQKLLNRQMKAEGNLNKLYGEALTELIDKVRIIQHNYENQLDAIKGMIFSANTLEELIEEHKKYCSASAHEDGYAKILSGNNDPVIAGFLYSKLCKVDVQQIMIEYYIRLNKIGDSFLETDVVKILGVLIDNALEEAVNYANPQIEIKVYEEKELKIEVGNICRVISNSEITYFFKNGSSTKGEGRGLGLFEVKSIVNKWKGTVMPQNIEKNEDNWFFILISIPLK